MVEELKEIIKRLERGETLYAVIAPFESYYSSKAEGDTHHYLLTLDSQPVFSIDFDENKAAGFIKEIPKESVIYKRTVVTKRYSIPYYEGGHVIYITTEPFKLWVRHKGYTGNRSDSYNKILNCEKIENIEALRALFKRAGTEE